MRKSEKEKLLNEVLADENLAELRRASLADGVGFLRRRKRRQFVLRAGILAIAICMCILGALWIHNSRRARRSLATVRPSEKPQPSSRPASGVRFISDDELLALFPNRPVALIGKPGQQRLVFLDQAHRQRLPQE